jgi:putative tricarboxylic transport membrane protein
MDRRGQCAAPVPRAAANGRHEMINLKGREVAIGIVMLLTGAAYLWATSRIPPKAAIDSTTVPTILGWLMCLLGAVQLGTAIRMPAGDSGGQGAEAVDYATLLKTAALIVGYVALLNTVGFVLMTVLYLVLQFIVLTPAGRRPTYLTYVVVAVVSTVVIYALFRYGFDMVLPVGLFDID